MIRDLPQLLARIRVIHSAIRDQVVAACEQSAVEQLAEVVGHDAGDTIFAIDRVSEAALLDHFAELAREWPLVLIAEGLGETGSMTLTPGGDPQLAEIRVIVDPIDGTRGLMYQKRSAWILTGVAPNHGPSTSLADIELAVQTEIPLVKQHLCDTLWAIAGQGAAGERFNRLTGERQPFVPHPSRAETLAQGYASVARFFPGARAELAAVDETVIEMTIGPVQPGKALVFEDQYISTGGQLYELMIGHDRWIADLRPLAEAIMRRRGLQLGLCCHPYDLSTELIAREAGVIVTDASGMPLQSPLDVTSELAWVGYANQAIYEMVAPALQKALALHGFVP